MVIVAWRSPDVPRERYRELAGGVHVSVKYIGKSMTTLLALIEHLHQSSSFFADPGFGDGFTGAVNDDCWRAGVDDDLDETWHHANQIQVVDVNVLAFMTLDVSFGPGKGEC